MAEMWPHRGFREVSSVNDANAAGVLQGGHSFLFSFPFPFPFLLHLHLQGPFATICST